MKWNSMANSLFAFLAHPLTLGSFIISLTIVQMQLLFKWVDWYAWIEWTIGIMAVLLIAFMFVFVAFFSEYYDEVKKQKTKSIEKAYNRCWRRMAFLSGWVEYMKPDFERKSPVLCAIGGVFKLLDD